MILCNVRQVYLYMWGYGAALVHGETRADCSPAVGVIMRISSIETPGGIELPPFDYCPVNRIRVT